MIVYVGEIYGVVLGGEMVVLVMGKFGGWEMMVVLDLDLILFYEVLEDVK